jgi:hypothetical protein
LGSGNRDLGRFSVSFRQSEYDGSNQTEIDANKWKDALATVAALRALAAPLRDDRERSGGK